MAEEALSTIDHGYLAAATHRVYHSKRLPSIPGDLSFRAASSSILRLNKDHGNWRIKRPPPPFPWRASQHLPEIREGNREKYEAPRIPNSARKIWNKDASVVPRNNSQRYRLWPICRRTFTIAGFKAEGIWEIEDPGYGDNCSCHALAYE